MSKPRLLLSWSSGKDSAWSLQRLRLAGEFEIAGLVTTINEAFDRVAMHAVRRELLEAQAAAAGLPLWPVPLPWPCSNEEYTKRMGAVVAKARGAGITHMAFGDLFLEDIRRYREEQLAGSGVAPVFPLWGLPTRPLAAEMIAAGLKAVLTCVDPRRLDRRFAGRTFDADLLGDLPATVDPCGENGEFHTFCFAGPMFRAHIAVRAGDVVERDGFCFADLLPADTPQ
ncbi:MAG: hypothetical protein FD180_1368 [Planctomycetota bacterium]|nr:MAG: hypothetical protein FD180_1368 [Planctomycetota bacterium]